MDSTRLFLQLRSRLFTRTIEYCSWLLALVTCDPGKGDLKGPPVTSYIKKLNNRVHDPYWSVNTATLGKDILQKKRMRRWANRNSKLLLMSCHCILHTAQLTAHLNKDAAWLLKEITQRGVIMKPWSQSVWINKKQWSKKYIFSSVDAIMWLSPISEANVE